jgi:hypothetical protein
MPLTHRDKGDRGVHQNITNHLSEILLMIIGEESIQSLYFFSSSSPSSL